MAVTLTSVKNLPPPQAPFVDPKTGILAHDGYQMLMDLINQLAEAVATATVATALQAKGATQATALQLSDQWNQVTAGSGAGVVLDPLQPGQEQIVTNETGGIIKVYPPAGGAINGGAANASVNLGSGATAAFRFFTATDIRSA